MPSRFLRVSRIVGLGAIHVIACVAHAGFDFSFPAPIDSGVGTNQQPVVVSDGHGGWHAAWIASDRGNSGADTEVWRSESTDNGTTWTTPEPFEPNAASDSINARGVRLASDSVGNLVAVWVRVRSNSPIERVDGDIMIARRPYGGDWTKPTRLNRHADSVNLGGVIQTSPDPDIAEHDGTWFVAWQSGDKVAGGGSYRLLISKSVDGGETWSKHVKVASGFAPFFYGHPHIAGFGDNKWGIVWNSGHPLIGDHTSPVMRALSDDDGATWTRPKNILKGTAERPWRVITSVATDSLGRCVAAGTKQIESLSPPYDDSDVFVIRSLDYGRTWSRPAIISVSPESAEFDDDQPVIVTDNHGYWLTLWTVHDQDDSMLRDADIFGSFSPDNGATWSAAVPLNRKANRDYMDDIDPALAADDDGNWLALWQSDGQIESAYSELTNGNNLVVVTPAGGETFHVGDTLDIQWLSIRNPGDKLDLFLMRDKDLVATIASNIPDTGSLQWQIPETIEPGVGFKIQIFCSDVAGCRSHNKQLFRIRHAQP